MDYLNITSLGVLCIFLALSLFRFIEKWKINPSGLPYPPGPKRLPIVGNMFGIPREKPWMMVDEWFQKYGDIVYYEVLGQGYLALGSLTRTRDLLEKKSNIYSSRPAFTMLRELCGRRDFDVGLMPYGPWWRRHRRVFHEHFNSKVVGKYRQIQERETHRLLQQISKEPDQFMSHIRYSMAGIFMDVTYGQKITGKNDPLLDALEDGTAAFRLASYPGKFLVDLIPSLRHIPDWFPGANFKRLAKEWEAATFKMIDVPYEMAKQDLSNGIENESMVSTMIHGLQDLNPEQAAEEEKIKRNSAGVTFSAGADTTHSAICTFVLAMALHQDIQKQAQEEIEMVVGSNRLPTFEDRDSMPFVNAIVKEVLRWQSVIPLGLAHKTTEDDIYDGYFIPQNTLVLGCTWSILHDPRNYSNPQEFNPSRFIKDGAINPDVLDPSMAAFGFGRRICPGKHFADETLFIIISSVLSTFKITPSEELLQKPSHLRVEMINEAVSCPAPFTCHFEPRNVEAVTLIGG